MHRLLDIVDQLVESVEQLDRRQSELEEYVEAVDEDLNDLELLVYDEEDEDCAVCYGEDRDRYKVIYTRPCREKWKK